MTLESKTQTTGVYLTGLLEAYGVEFVFGIPGVHTVELYRGLANSGLRHISPRHEQGAGFMADGYARASGKPGVCFIISGPGMTNIVTAMGQAYGDSIPMLVISTVNARGRMGSGEGWLHELPNQSALIAGVAAFSRTVHSPEELAPTLAQAFAVFDGARPRPVHIEIPIDVLNASAEHLPTPKCVSRVNSPGPSSTAILEAAEMLSNALAPLILVGGGAIRAAEAIRLLARKLDAPVVMTTNGRGILLPDDPLQVSLSPSMLETRQLIAKADVVLAVGTELGPTDYDFYEDGNFLLPGTLIRIDIDPAQLMRTKMPAIAILADARHAAEGLLGAVKAREPGQGELRAATARAGREALSAAMQGDLILLDIIRDTLPNALIVGDSTQLVYAGNTCFAANCSGGYFNSATGFGTLGYGLPAALGARLAGTRPVVAISGDGGLQFSLGELASVVEAKAPIIMVLHDNQGYGEIKSYMIAEKVAPLGVDILTPDLASIAKACGWCVDMAQNIHEFQSMLLGGLDRDVPTLIMFDENLRAEAQSIVIPKLQGSVRSPFISVLAPTT